jgi:hypothetical protein
MNTLLYGEGEKEREKEREREINKKDSVNTNPKLSMNWAQFRKV